MSDTQVIVMTCEQLKEFAHEIATEILSRKTEQPEAETKPPKRYVYGLHGIAELFDVSIVTAQRYKNTFLAPAIMQRGRKIVVDADAALQLYNQNNI